MSETDIVSGQKNVMMTREHPELAGMAKVGYHREKVSACLDGREIYPVTLELDLTSECTRKCAECPSTRALRHHYLDRDFLDRLLGVLGGHTRGLLLTGGEPTMAPLFPDALRMARQKGFTEIAVVTNGSLLEKPEVVDALLTFVTTIRISLYDWDGKMCDGIDTTLGRIETLREKIEGSGSDLRIGVSALTSSARLPMLGKLSESVRSAGAHWIYFHPLCHKWELGCPEQSAQDGVMEKIGELREKEFPEFKVFVSRERYERNDIEFDGYHAANFLLVVGADANNYLAPEVKYHPKHVIANLGEGLQNGFLWKQMRLDKINEVRSATYPAVRSRHRGVLYNHYIERLKLGDEAVTNAFQGTSSYIVFPHIL